MKKLPYNFILGFKKGGFTLIELLVVIAIIGILSAVVMSNFSVTKSKSRDAKRISDIAQIQLTLELYFDRCNAYPSVLTLSGDTSCANGVTLGTFITTIPTNFGSTYSYTRINGTSDYILMVPLESDNTVLSDDLDGSNVNGVNCDDRNYCVKPK